MFISDVYVVFMTLVLRARFCFFLLAHAITNLLTRLTPHREYGVLLILKTQSLSKHVNLQLSCVTGKNLDGN